MNSRTSREGRVTAPRANSRGPLEMISPRFRARETSLGKVDPDLVGEEPGLVSGAGVPVGTRAAVLADDADEARARVRGELVDERRERGLALVHLRRHAAEFAELLTVHGDREHDLRREPDPRADVAEEADADRLHVALDAEVDRRVDVLALEPLPPARPPVAAAALAVDQRIRAVRGVLRGVGVGEGELRRRVRLDE